MAYPEHLLLARLGHSPLPFQLSLCLMFQASNLLRAEHAGWLPHALQVTSTRCTADIAMVLCYGRKDI